MFVWIKSSKSRNHPLGRAEKFSCHRARSSSDVILALGLKASSESAQLFSRILPSACVSHLRIIHGRVRRIHSASAPVRNQVLPWSPDRNALSDRFGKCNSNRCALRPLEFFCPL